MNGFHIWQLKYREKKHHPEWCETVTDEIYEKLK